MNEYSYEEETNKGSLKDSRLYITQNSELEEMLYKVSNSTIKSMYETSDKKKDALRDSLKIINFNKTLDKTRDINEEYTEQVQDIHEKAMFVCSDFKTYLNQHCENACRFIIENHNSIKILLDHHKQNIESLTQVKNKYMYRNSLLVNKEYQQRVLDLSNDFEKNIKFIQEKKFEPNVERKELTEKFKQLQYDFLNAYKHEPMEMLLNAKEKYEQDIYDIELEVCNKFKKYILEWSKSLAV